MKIGVLGSSNDIVSLFSFLQHYDNDYIVRYDDKFSFWGDKDVDLVMERVTHGLKFLKEKGAEIVLVPPIIELKIRNEGLFSDIKILPLFATYVQENCFKYSLVGKIGFFGDFFDIKEGQKQLINLAKNYVLSDNQSGIKKFNFPFAYRSKEVRNWKYFLDTCSWSMPFLHNRIKQDLRYFKDANVDTIIPCNYSYFLAQKAIEKARYSDMRFYGLTVLEKIFASFVSDKSSNYSVSVYFTGHGEFLKREKKLMWLMGRGDLKCINFTVLD